MVSPFAIKNLTDKDVKVFSLKNDIRRGSILPGMETPIDNSGTFTVRPCMQKNIKISLTELLKK